ncbi:metallo-dependent hydrolase [Vibrio tritonius]|uniref:metallo-dependent hydrolase n=1 Tax=Vibrio tritonius TaxID=1435069 RepID=UPI00083916A2|nr:metallo-dependent hydrolase [Vibrio tritonius]
MKIDILIKNGTTYDSDRNDFTQTDIGIVGDKIVDIKDKFVDADTVIDAQGCYVVPGLIDFHAHIYEDGTAIGVNPDVICLPNGVTSVVDAGSCGWVNFPAFYKHVVTPAMVKIRSYLNVVNVGLSTLGGGPTGYLENTNPANYNIDKISALVKSNDNILGLKLRYSKDITINKGFEKDPLEVTAHLAKELNTHFCVHVTDSTRPLYEAIEYFGQDDVLAHCYHGVGNTIIDDNGKVYPEIKDAQKRGVIFDCSNGVAHFDFKVAKAAIDDGFYPDIISTDLTQKNSLRTEKVFSLLYVMSKYLNLGVPLNNVIKAVTSTPARLMHMQGEIGTLSPGAFADISLLKKEMSSVEFEDTNGVKIHGDHYLDNVATVCDGKLVYRRVSF